MLCRNLNSESFCNTGFELILTRNMCNSACFLQFCPGSGWRGAILPTGLLLRQKLFPTTLQIRHAQHRSSPLPLFLTESTGAWKKMSHAKVHVMWGWNQAGNAIIVMIMEQSGGFKKFPLSYQGCDHFITMIMVVVHVLDWAMKRSSIMFGNCLCSAGLSSKLSWENARWNIMIKPR